MVDKSRKREVKVAPKKATKKTPVKKAAKPKKAAQKPIKAPRAKPSPKKEVRKEAILEQELRKKILRRAGEAWKAPTEHHHRISDVTETSLTYRLPHEEGQAEYYGPRLSVEKTGETVKIYNK